MASEVVKRTAWFIEYWEESVRGWNFFSTADSWMSCVARIQAEKKTPECRDLRFRIREIATVERIEEW